MRTKAADDLTDQAAPGPSRAVQVTTRRSKTHLLAKKQQRGSEGNPEQTTNGAIGSRFGPADRRVGISLKQVSEQAFCL